MWRCVTLLGIAYALSHPASGQIVATRINGAIVLDGRIQEAAWEGVQPLTGFRQNNPQDGAEPTERTELRVGFDERYLYVAFVCFDSEPEAIIANALERDAELNQDDHVTIVLDTYLTRLSGLGFSTNPNGVRRDFAIFNDAAERIPLDPNWNTFWDVATARGDWGWSAEFRIPLSSLRYQVQNGQARMGFIASRMIRRKSELALLPHIGREFRNAQWRVSQAADLILPLDRPSRPPFYLTPYALGGYGQDARPAGLGYRMDPRWVRNVGLDAKYGLSSNLTLDLTANTDFAQVEVDDQQINLSRFSIFIPEKRDFFLEYASLFNVGFLFRVGQQQNRLFHSRSIGIEQGQQVPILGGARLTGRVGDWEIGLIEMQTGAVRKAELNVGSRNFGVLRLKRRVWNENSFLGLLWTSRLDLDSRSWDATYALDGLLRYSGTHYLSFLAAQTRNTVEGRPQAPGWDNALVHISLEDRRNSGFTYNAMLSYVGDSFEPRLGFLVRRGYYRAAGEFSQYFFQPASSPVRNFMLNFDPTFFWNTRGQLETAEITLGWATDTKTGAHIHPMLQYTFDRVPRAFLIYAPKNIRIPAGRYRFWTLDFHGFLGGASRLSGNWRINVGSYYGGWRWSSSLSPSWVLNRHLVLGLQHNLGYADLPGGAFTTQVLRLRAQYAFNAQWTAKAFVQYTSALRTVDVNFRLRFTPREGVNLYVVYNETLNTERGRTSPALPWTNSRALMLKYSYTFGW
ncbi:MAG: carbohydrate binding family 9 domain-containing protein [Bacteroidetes bacterium]|nr:carbohydrate binding family 9 domain-containing protein [Bacteroidota bacterium]